MITNTSKPTTSLANVTRTPSGETWATITTTEGTETRTWAEVGSFIDNLEMSQTDFLWSLRTFPWALALPWQQTGGITNIAKP